MSENANGESGDERPFVELFVKASPISKEDKGSCPISQQWFMAFYLLAEQKYLNLFVTTVNLDVPPDDYVALDVGRHLPVVRIIRGADPRGGDFSGAVFDTNDEIEQLMDMWKCPSLALPRESRDEAAAERAIGDLYKNLNLMLKTNSRGPLVNSLRKIDNFLGSRQCRYMLSDQLTYADCQLMPKLHHVKLASKFYRGFEVPEELRHLQDYYSAMYTGCEAFSNSCPADRDVLQLYYDKLPREVLTGLQFQPTLMDGRREALGEGGHNGPLA